MAENFKYEHASGNDVIVRNSYVAGAASGVTLYHVTLY